MNANGVQLHVLSAFEYAKEPNMSEYNQSEYEREREPENTQQNPASSGTENVLSEIKAKLLFFVAAVAFIIIIKVFLL